MAEEDQRAAREADVAGGDRREAERGEGSNDSRHEQMDSCIRSEGIRFLEAAQSPRAQSRDEARTSDGDDDRAGFEQPPQLLQVLLALLRDEGAELLLDERRERGRPELTADTEPVAVLS